MMEATDFSCVSAGTGYTVLGASGFIGSRVVSALRASGATCYVPAKGSEEIFTRNLGRVFYCIGLTADYAVRPFDAVNAHISYFARILAEANFERIVYLSSTRLYDGQTSGLEDEPLFLNPTKPRHLYDLSKAMGENLCMVASDGRGRVARLSNVYDATTGSAGFLSELLIRLKTERKFTLESSPDFSRDYISIDDVISALTAILDSDMSEIVNVASGENVTNQELINHLNQSGCTIEFRDNQKTEHQSVVCDVSRLKSLHVHPLPVQSYLEIFMRHLNGYAIR